jgi:hypothetical protein
MRADEPGPEIAGGGCLSIFYFSRNHSELIL